MNLPVELTYTYTYDNVGNILTANTTTGSHTYRYENTGWRDQLTHYDNQALAYDAIGNPTSYYNGTRWTMTWQNGRQLTTASDGTTNVSYAYDYASGMRTKKTVGSTETRYYYAGDKLMRMETGNNVLDFFYDQNGQPYAVNYNGTMCYYVLNLQGDVVRIVNSVGTSYGIYQYDAWGNILYSTNSSLVNLNPLRYRGYVYDAETGFYYLQSRYYDPKIGRFLNVDSYASTGQGFLGYNMFAYGMNNPVNMSDSTGNWPKLSTVLAAVAVTAIAVAAVAITVATCGAAAPALAVAGGGIIGGMSAGAVAAATSLAVNATIVAVASGTAAAISKNEEKKREKSYSVYFLEDERGTIQYVGRVTDQGYAARMNHHYSTRRLTPAKRIPGLSYKEARGLEEMGMITCHTLNAMNPINNQIHGISSRNKNGEIYMEAACNYLFNRAEDWVLNLFD